MYLVAIGRLTGKQNDLISIQKFTLAARWRQIEEARRLSRKLKNVQVLAIVTESRSSRYRIKTQFLLNPALEETHLKCSGETKYKRKVRSQSSFGNGGQYSQWQRPTRRVAICTWAVWFLPWSPVAVARGEAGGTLKPRWTRQNSMREATRVHNRLWSHGWASSQARLGRIREGLTHVFSDFFVLRLPASPHSRQLCLLILCAQL